MPKVDLTERHIKVLRALLREERQHWGTEDWQQKEAEYHGRDDATLDAIDLRLQGYEGGVD